MEWEGRECGAVRTRGKLAGRVDEEGVDGV